MGLLSTGRRWKRRGGGSTWTYRTTSRLERLRRDWGGWTRTRSGRAGGGSSCWWVEQRRQAPPVGRSAYERSLAYERALAGLSPRDAAQHELWRQGLDADTPLAHMLGLPGRERAAEQRRQALQDWDEPQPEAPVWLVYLGGLWTWAGSLALASAPVLALVLPLLWLAFG